MMMLRVDLVIVGRVSQMPMTLSIFPPDRQDKPHPIDLPNKLGFIALPQLGLFVGMLNKARHCQTPGCSGNLIPMFVNRQGICGSLSVTFYCDGCFMNPVHM